MMPSTSRLLQRAFAAARCRPAPPSQPVPASISVHHRRGPGVDRLEDQEHHHGERQQPEHRDAAASGRARRRSWRCARGMRTAAASRRRVSCMQASVDTAPVPRVRPGAARRDARPAPVDRAASTSAAAPSRMHGDGFDHRHAEFALQHVQVDRRCRGAARHRPCSRASTIGLPSSRTSSAKRRCRRRLVASTTQTSTSGAGSPG